MTKAEICELYTSTLDELSSMCPQRLPDVFGGIDGYYVGDYRTERAENNSYLTEPSEDPQEFVTEALERWGDQGAPGDRGQARHLP